MKAITIWQPYAAAIRLGLKHYETRSWPTKYRGPLVIHAAQKQPTSKEKDLIGKYKISDTDLVFGVPIVVCEIEDCIPITKNFIKQQPKEELDFGDWREGRFAWKLKVVKVLVKQKKIRGQQGLWNINL